MKLFLFIAAMLGVLHHQDARAAAGSCAMLKNLKGESCTDLKYDVDLAACPEKTLQAPAQVECNGKSAQVMFKAGKTNYVAHLALGSANWGHAGWSVQDVREKAGSTTATAAPAAPTAAKVVAHEAPAPKAEIAPKPAATAPEAAHKAATEAMPESANNTKAPTREVASETSPLSSTASVTPGETKVVKSAETPAPAPVAPAAPAPGAAVSPQLEVNGYLDVSFQNNFNKQPSSDTHTFSKKNGAIQLNVAEATIKRKQGDVGIRLDVAAGENVDALSPAVSANGTTSLDASRNFLQAFLTYTPSQLPGLTVNAGKMYTHLGFEVVRAKDNWNYSRGLLFGYGIPLWHEGINVAYAFVPDKLTAGVYVYNGWNGPLSVTSGTNQSTTLGANLTYTGIAGLTAIYNYIGGPEGADSRSLREVHEVNAMYAINDRFSVAVDAIMGSQRYAIGDSSARWNSWAVYGKAVLAPSWPLSLVLRYENFDDSDQGFAIRGGFAAAGDKLKVQSMTVGLNADLGGGLESRIEYRHDMADQDSALYVQSDGKNGKMEDTLNLALLYAF